MNHRKILSVALVSLLSLKLTGYVILHPSLIGMCDPADSSCGYQNFYTIGMPLYRGLDFFIYVLVLMFFFSKKVFRVWCKLVSFYAPLSLLIIVTTESQCSEILCLDRVSMAKFLGKILLYSTIVLNLITLMFYWWKNRKGKMV